MEASSLHFPLVTGTLSPQMWHYFLLRIQTLEVNGLHHWTWTLRRRNIYFSIPIQSLSLLPLTSNQINFISVASYRKAISGHFTWQALLRSQFFPLRTSTEATVARKNLRPWVYPDSQIRVGGNIVDLLHLSLIRESHLSAKHTSSPHWPIASPVHHPFRNSRGRTFRRT